VKASQVSIAVAESALALVFDEMQLAFERWTAVRLGTPAERRARDDYWSLVDAYRIADARLHYLRCASSGTRHLRLVLSVDSELDTRSSTKKEDRIR
jgi:hypothetical protein